jgi:hypothetical protein
MRSILVALAAISAVASPAAAQDTPIFVNVNFGFQAQSQDLRQAGEFPLYDETGSWEAEHSIKGGPYFDLGGGLLVWRKLSIGAAYTARAKHSRDVAVNAAVPSPVFTDSFRHASAPASGLQHSERAVHLQALWHVPVTVEFDVTVFGGPTFFSIRDELIDGVEPSEVGGDFSTVNVGIRTARQRNTTTGFNIGIDTRYMLRRNLPYVRRVGAGAMLRYSHGSTKLESAQGGRFTVDAGGLEIAAGLRFRF